MRLYWDNKLDDENASLSYSSIKLGTDIENIKQKHLSKRFSFNDNFGDVNLEFLSNTYDYDVSDLSTVVSTGFGAANMRSLSYVDGFYFMNLQDAPTYSKVYRSSTFSNDIADWTEVLDLNYVNDVNTIYGDGSGNLVMVGFVSYAGVDEVRYSTDYGSTWLVSTVPTQANRTYYNFYIDGTDLYLVGDRIIKSTDGGANFTVLLDSVTDGYITSMTKFGSDYFYTTITYPVDNDLATLNRTTDFVTITPIFEDTVGSGANYKLPLVVSNSSRIVFNGIIDGTINTYKVSTDGTNWTTETLSDFTADNYDILRFEPSTNTWLIGSCDETFICNEINFGEWESISFGDDVTGGLWPVITYSDYKYVLKVDLNTTAVQGQINETVTEYPTKIIKKIIIGGSNCSESGSIKVYYSNTEDTFTNFVQLEKYGDNWVGDFDGQEYQYWKIEAEDTSQVYLWIGYVYLGDFLQMPGIDPNYVLNYKTTSARTLSVSLQPYGDKGIQNFSSGFTFPIITDYTIQNPSGIDMATRYDILEMWYSVEGHTPFYLEIAEDSLDVIPPYFGIFNKSDMVFKMDKTQSFYSLGFYFQETK